MLKIFWTLLPISTHFLFNRSGSLRNGILGFLKNPLKNPILLKKEVGFLSEFSKVGFVENYGISFIEKLRFQNGKYASI